MKITPFVLLIVFAAHYCDAISCYECIHGKSDAGTTNGNCGEDFDSSGIKVVGCDGGCYKVYGKKNDRVGIIRGCTPRTALKNASTTDTCVHGSNAAGSGSVCICFSDKCNAGHRVGSVALATLFIGVFVSMTLGN